MTPENAKALLPIIAAYAEGKTIQLQNDTEWFDANSNLRFDEKPEHYRIKPEKKKIKIALFGSPFGLTSCFLQPQQAILRDFEGWKQLSDWIKIEYEEL